MFLFAEYKPVTLSIDNVILLTVSKCNMTTRCSDSGRPSGGGTIFLSFLSLPENLL